MSMHLQQLNVRSKLVRRLAGAVVRPPLLKANSTLLLLVLVIIPTLSGVALIA